MDSAPVSRREDILAISARLFAERGFDRTTMREIAAEAGIQAASLYHHFATKDDILHAVIRDFLQGLPKAYRDIIAENPGPDRVIRVFVAFALHIALENSVVLSIVIRERKALAGHAGFAYVEATMREVRAIWLEMFQKGAAQGVFRQDLNPHVVIRMMMDLVGSAAEWYRPNSGRYDFDDVIRTELGFIFNGIEAR
ncbi:MAG: transcriptional regulator, TetR family [Rhodospirillales bacterium]|nr:transcriptional regulator, TetR family [Rhodospirillales bacterium]